MHPAWHGVNLLLLILLLFQDGQTFLMVASQVGELQIVQELLCQPNVDVNAVDNVRHESVADNPCQKVLRHCMSWAFSSPTESASVFHKMQGIDMNKYPK